MATYPFMVQTAYNVLSSVFEQWHKQPYRWMKERDLQSEIGGRLMQIFTLQGLGDIQGIHKWKAPGFDDKQVWSRISYEPYVAYEYDNGKTSYCYPDIVIWDSREKNDVIPDGQLWPILWACELKYGSSDDGNYDVKKLTSLIDQGKIKFGCSVRVHFVKDPSGVGIKWKTSTHGHYLWECDVRMPEGEKEQLTKGSS